MVSEDLFYLGVMGSVLDSVSLSSPLYSFSLSASLTTFLHVDIASLMANAVIAIAATLYHNPFALSFRAFSALLSPSLIARIEALRISTNLTSLCAAWILEITA